MPLGVFTDETDRVSPGRFAVGVSDVAIWDRLAGPSGSVRFASAAAATVSRPSTAAAGSAGGGGDGRPSGQRARGKPNRAGRGAVSAAAVETGREAVPPPATHRGSGPNRRGV